VGSPTPGTQPTDAHPPGHRVAGDDDGHLVDLPDLRELKIVDRYRHGERLARADAEIRAGQPRGLGRRHHCVNGLRAVGGRGVGVELIA
jgi:hypothetical protein